jgi:hypothetical protein
LTNAGGTPNYITSLREDGMCSTAELAQKLGLPGLQATWIINTLQVRPRIVIRQGAAMYWGAEQVADVRRALIAHLLKQEL